MTNRVVLAIDQGTTSTKALLVNAAGEVMDSVAVQIGISSPRPTWVEQDPAEVWQSVLQSVGTVTSANPRLEVVAVAISNQRESVLAWEPTTGRPVSPIISWQDQRGEAYRAALQSPGVADLVSARTGLEISSMYSALKLRWLGENLDLTGAQMGTVDSWLVTCLTGEPSAVEVGNAARTMLFDIDKLTWDEDLLSLFGVPPHSLPPVVHSDEMRGGSRGIPGLRDGTPVLAVLGDSHAALYGHWALAPEFGRAGKVTYGTGSSVMLPAEGPEDRRLGVATTLAWVINGRPLWAYEGNILYSGAGMDFLAGILGVAGGRGLSELAAGAEDSGGVAYVPALNGLGAPWWTPSATGTLTGMSAATSRAQIARSGLDSVAHQVADVVEVMTAGSVPEALHAGGGATASELLMQIQSDLIGAQIVVSVATDVSALGAAALAWRQLGVQFEPGSGGRITGPSESAHAARVEARALWRQALERAGVPQEKTDQLNRGTDS